MDGVTIRCATDRDRRALHRLAALDSAGWDGGPALVASVHDELWAALPLAGGAAIADPFRPTADVVALLQLRAAQLESPERGPTGRRGLRVRRRRAGVLGPPQARAAS